MRAPSRCGWKRVFGIADVCGGVAGTVPAVPFTFFAHQAPVLPIARRWPTAVDGLALVIGSMSPDFAYVLNGSRFDVWAHGFPGVVTFCVPITILVSWLVARVLAPVVPEHLPDLGGFHLREFRGLATHRFTWWKVGLWAEVGALSHVGLDEFTHEWGWFAHHVSWYTTHLTDHRWLGREWTLFRLVQYAGHVAGTVVCIWLLWRYGRKRWMAERASHVPQPVTSVRSHVALWTPAAVGLVAASVWVGNDSQGSATDIIRLACGLFTGLIVGACFARRLVRPPTPGDHTEVRERTRS